VRVEFAPLLSPAPAPPETDLDIVAEPLGSARLPSSSDPFFFRTALQAGLLGVMANFIVPGPGMLLTGMMAALLYHRANTGRLRGAKAARLGAMAGAISFGASALLAVMAVVLLHSQQQVREFIMKAAEQSVANPSDPDLQATLRWLHTPEGFSAYLALIMASLLIFSMLFSALGGVIGSTLFRDRGRPRL
jgi:hypothetical protein